MDDSIKSQLIDFLSQKLKIDKSKISNETFLASDLELTSFEIIQLMCDIEDKFNVEIPQEVFLKLTNIGKLAEYIEQKKQKK